MTTFDWHTGIQTIKEESDHDELLGLLPMTGDVRMQGSIELSLYLIVFALLAKAFSRKRQVRHSVAEARVKSNKFNKLG